MKATQIWIERLLTIPLIACPIFLYQLLWGVDLPLWAVNSFTASQAGALLAIGLLLISVILHESLHGIGLVILGHVSWRTIRFRFNKWPKWTPCTTCTQPISVWAYRLSALLPMLVLGTIPGIIGLFWHINWLAFWALLNGSFCTNDLIGFRMSLEYRSCSILPMRQ